MQSGAVGATAAAIAACEEARSIFELRGERFPTEEIREVAARAGSGARKEAALKLAGGGEGAGRV
jgi:hypothetical protein